MRYCVPIGLDIFVVRIGATLTHEWGTCLGVIENEGYSVL